MSILHRAWEVFRSEGVANLLKKGSRYCLDSTQSRVSSLYPARNVFEAEWDVLLILDGCRYDLMESVAPDFDFISDVEQTASVGSKTTEWMEKTFTSEYQAEMANTAYVTGNPNTAKFVSKDDFARLDEMWRYTWDDDVGTMPMEPLTDRAIQIARTHDVPRLIVHYMQPHEPFLTAPELGGEDTVERKTDDANDAHRSVWTRLETGEITEDIVWSHYEDNLRCVLKNVGLLLNNIDAENVVITSDHGNAFGEWGQYGHPAYRPISALRNVPWVETSATDTASYEPTKWTIEESDEVESRLSDLGYLP